jgi:hypothetical protein
VALCSVSDVSLRLGLDAAQRTRATSRIESAIRRATIHIDSVFRDFGRDSPSEQVASSTLSSGSDPAATSITLASGAAFSDSGNGSIDGDSFAWTGKSVNTLTGVTGLTASHSSGATVLEGEFAHVLREVCADVAAGLYFQDEAVFSSESEMRSPMFLNRGNELLFRYARLGSVD